MMLTDRKDLSEVERCARVWAAIQLQAVVRGRRARADVVREIQQHGTLLARASAATAAGAWAATAVNAASAKVAGAGDAGELGGDGWADRARRRLGGGLAAEAAGIEASIIVVLCRNLRFLRS